MNVLAHAYLSPPDPGILVGNVVADWVKGKARHALPENVRLGMLLHRRIDVFTDTHPLVADCTSVLSPRWHRYSAILVDMFFDHLLAASWPHHHDQHLPDFAQQTYTTLATHQPMLPDMCNHALCAMIADDWLSSYASLDGIRLALSRMSVRLRSRGHDIELAPAVDDFFRRRSTFKSAFAGFFPELQHSVATHLEATPVS